MQELFLDPILLTWLTDLKLGSGQQNLIQEQLWPKRKF